MKKCTKCGKTIQEGRFCPYCGTKVVDNAQEFFEEPGIQKGELNKETLNKEKLNTDELKNTALKVVNFFKNNKKVTGVAAGVICLLIIIGFVLGRGKSFDFANYVNLESSINGHGRCDGNIDYEQFAEDIMKDSKIQEKVQEYFKNYPLAEAYEEDDYEYLLEDKLESNLDVTVDIKKGTQGELKNGDKVKLTLVCNNKKFFQKMGIRFSPSSKTITIKGLKDAETIDYFDGMTLEDLGLQGVAPYGKVSSEVSNKLPDNKTISMTCSPSEGLSNGDKVTVTIDSDSNNEDVAYVPKSKSKTFTVKGLEEYVIKLEQIDKDIMDSIVKQAQDAAMSYAAQNSDYGTVELTPIGTYLLTAKEEIDGGYYNKVIVVFKAKSTIAGKQIENYSYISFTDAKMVDGKAVVDLGEYHSPYESSLFSTEGGEGYDIVIGDSTYWAKGFKSIEELFNQKVETDVEAHNVETSEGLYKR